MLAQQEEQERLVVCFDFSLRLKVFERVLLAGKDRLDYNLDWLSSKNLLFASRPYGFDIEGRNLNITSFVGSQLEFQDLFDVPVCELRWRQRFRTSDGPLTQAGPTGGNAILRVSGCFIESLTVTTSPMVTVVASMEVFSWALGSWERAGLTPRRMQQAIQIPRISRDQATCASPPHP